MLRSKEYALITVASAAVFLITCWTAIFKDSTPLWVQSISFWGLTWYLLNRLAPTGRALYSLVLCIIIGRIIPEIPVRMLDWSNSSGSIDITIVSIVGIVFGAVSYKWKSPITNVCLWIILVLLNSAGHAWYENWWRAANAI